MIQAQSNQGQPNSVVEFTTQICSLIGKEVIKVQCCRVYNTDLLAHWIRSYQSASSPKHNLQESTHPVRISFHYAAVITGSTITTTFHYTFSTSSAHGHLTALLIKHYLTNYGSCDSCEWNCDVPYNDICFFEMTTCVTGVPHMTNYIFPPHFELFNGYRLSLRHRKNKALYSWLSSRLSWSHQPSEKRPLSNRLWMFTEGDDEVVLLTPRQQGKGRTCIQIQPLQQAW
jgi:hypothetical protein